MWGLISRLRRGQAPSPAVLEPTPEQVEERTRRLAKLEMEVGVLASIAARREHRLTQPPRTERKRFERARPKVEQLRHAIAMQMVDL